MSTVTKLIDRGLQLRREIKERQAELKDIEGQIENIGLHECHTRLKDEAREGTRWLAPGSACLIPVVFTADKLVQSFADQSPAHKIIESVSNGKMSEFFQLTRTWKTKIDDGKKFRAAADELLGKAAPLFVTACVARDKSGIAKNDIRICWDDAEPL